MSATGFSTRYRTKGARVMIKWLIIFGCILFPALLRAQNPPVLKGWDEAVVKRANTAMDADFMNQEEKKVVLYMNLARTDGSLFANTLLKAWLKDKTKTRYTRSLIRDLGKTSGLPLLEPRKDLFEIAAGHAVRSGRRGTTGHQGFDKRFEPVLGTYQMAGENCAYGYNKAEDIVIGLLIDEGIRDLGHRKNILKPEFNAVGVAIRPHKKYNYNCVMDFGKK
ncbi:MAG TPA: CAP domain-containing protein [Bacteroidales bacterium]|nr:CAP domain-containing protein [Bacteroidales bacterium]